jgi:hypothetical protein
MPAEHVVAAAALVFILVGGLGLLVSVVRGRRVCADFALRHPDLYAEVGEPRPGFFDSPRRDAYLRFVLERGYEAIPDPTLVEAFTRVRRHEVLELGYLLVGFALLGLAVLWLEVLRPGA